ncbi:uncharacterized protein I303_104883 [Kwoniella dejecticola CBS 10117]|uniref:Major facilitator superfamily (MFS) profile domain-containing protein n=1 Tax=Kwoniella dejecticola CBS 10117 TaxID=1296121 RepID=A0A1A6A428_9TREE|nr:uncharacterized protein I303_04133 [Kwoniella dejecticola CBS 10117]OBR84812.1 hypothetical protein I303_04133 [Kwoniella dejecticola CBS 10117]
MRTILGKKGETLQEFMNFCVVVPVFLAMGFSLSYGGGITGYKTFYTLFPEIDTTTTKGAVKSHNSLIQGTTVASLNLGAALGCLSTMYLGNKLGRRRTVMLGAIVALIGTILQCSAYYLAQLIVSRMVLGAGLGMMSSTVPVWQSETSKVHKRGHHVIIDGICIAAGIALSSWLTFGFSKAETTSSWNWRLPGMTTGILAIIVMIFTFSFPESPRWLALKGRPEEAREVIALVDDVEPHSEHTEFVLASITSVNELSAESASFTSLFKYGKEKMLYRLILASATQLFSQMSGSALITYYSSQLFSTIGLSKDLSKILGATDLTFKLICCSIPFFTIERAGRRRLLMIAASGMSACMFALAICGSQVTDDNLVPAYVAIVFAFLFVAFYPIGFLGVNFLYSQEVITTRYRAPASGISTAVHWLSAFVVALTTPIGFTSLGWKFYLVWAAVALSIIPSVYFFYPETTGLSVEEIDQVFIDSPSVFATVGLAEQRRREKAREVAVVAGEVEQFDGAKKAEEQYEQALVQSRA